MNPADCTFYVAVKIMDMSFNLQTALVVLLMRHDICKITIFPCNFNLNKKICHKEKHLG